MKKVVCILVIFTAFILLSNNTSLAIEPYVKPLTRPYIKPLIWRTDTVKDLALAHASSVYPASKIWGKVSWQPFGNSDSDPIGMSTGNCVQSAIANGLLQFTTYAKQSIDFNTLDVIAFYEAVKPADSIGSHPLPV